MRGQCEGYYILGSLPLITRKIRAWTAKTTRDVAKAAKNAPKLFADLPATWASLPLARRAPTPPAAVDEAELEDVVRVEDMAKWILYTGRKGQTTMRINKRIERGSDAR